MKEIDSLDLAIADGMAALKYFEETGDRSKFVEWEERWGSLIEVVSETWSEFYDTNKNG